MKKALEKYLFPAVLLLWPLAACLQGVCVSDPTYSLGNYIHLFEMEKGSTWMFATYLANLLGSLIIRLPFGDSMAAMNIMTALAG